MILDLDAIRAAEGSPELLPEWDEQELRDHSPSSRKSSRRPIAPVWPAVLFCISILFWALVFLAAFAAYGLFAGAAALSHQFNS